jgi:hypothetical protein
MSRFFPIATVSVIAFTALPLAAQQEAASAVSTVRNTVSRAAPFAGTMGRTTSRLTLDALATQAAAGSDGADVPISPDK